ncbi:hypothetical protein A4D02_01945 [Niastella koreensis]|uniref:RDD domain containing protein n=2 Tax=Niastella koreensis TaxID=354356 RepID=G8TGC4_NIAKG|nr:RDD family protein [Niastella koreensis]AEW02763.1 RDD domain containing protein [Niastella koreensis GR20-10]OQP55104.1 hypothetical protein A4D02_01945 [Niastella koreensis]
MKKQTTLVIALTLLLLIFQYLLRIPYLKNLFSGSIQFQGNPQLIFDVFLSAIYMIVDLVIIVTGAIALAQSDVQQKERTYAWFRYMFVMMSIFSLLIELYYFYLSGRYLFHDLFHGIVRVIMFPCQAALVVFLIRIKPAGAVPRVNLQDYDVVVYTNSTHRFVHYLLDFIFITPIWLNIIQLFLNVRSFGWGGDFDKAFVQVAAQLMIGVAFFFYYFISEAIFCQTFGKMATRSCVVTNGVEFSNGRMFIRTLSRLIPFDKFSFLFGANWHDRASSTAVVYVDTWEKTFEDKANSDLG